MQCLWHLLCFVVDQKLVPVRKKYKKKLKQLLEVHDQHIDRNGRTLSRKEHLTNQTQSITPFPLAYLAFDGISLPLVIDELLLLCSHRFRIVLRASQTWAAQTDPMPLAECTVRSCPINLFGRNHFRVVSMVAIAPRLNLRALSLVVRVKTKSIKEGNSISSDGDRDLSPKFNTATRLAANNRSDMRLEEAHDTVRDACAISVIENGLLTDQFTDHKQLLVDMPSGSQKAARAIDQGVHACQIPPHVAKLMLDGLAKFGEPGLLLFRYSQKLLPCFSAVCARLMAKSFPDLRMLRIDQDLSHLPGLVQQ